MTRLSERNRMASEARYEERAAAESRRVSHVSGREIAGQMPTFRDCPACGGTGEAARFVTCGDCQGNGWIES